MRSSRSASSSAWRAVKAWATRPRACPTRLPASALALGGSAPISRLARARALLSPWWALRAALSSSSDVARGGRGERGGDGGVERLGVEAATSTGS